MKKILKSSTAALAFATFLFGWVAANTLYENMVRVGPNSRFGG